MGSFFGVGLGGWQAANSGGGIPTDITYYFNAYDSGGEEWGSNPENMVDGSLDTEASTIFSGAVELLTGNTCDGSNLGTISKVEIRAYGKVAEEAGQTFYLRPVFSGSDDGDNNETSLEDNLEWSDMIDITENSNAPETWSWSDVQNLDCDVYFAGLGLPVECRKVEIKVSYTTA